MRKGRGEVKSQVQKTTKRKLNLQCCTKKFEYKMRYVSAGAAGRGARGARGAQVRGTGNRTAQSNDNGQRSCGNNEIAYVNLMSLPTASAALLK